MFGILLLKRTEIQSEPAFGVGKIVLQDVMAIRGRVMNDSPLSLHLLPLPPLPPCSGACTLSAPHTYLPSV